MPSFNKEFIVTLLSGQVLPAVRASAAPYGHTAAVAALRELPQSVHCLESLPHPTVEGRQSALLGESWGLCVQQAPQQYQPVKRVHERVIWCLSSTERVGMR